MTCQQCDCHHTHQDTPYLVKHTPCRSQTHTLSGQTHTVSGQPHTLQESNSPLVKAGSIQTATSRITVAFVSGATCTEVMLVNVAWSAAAAAGVVAAGLAAAGVAAAATAAAALWCQRGWRRQQQVCHTFAGVAQQLVCLKVCVLVWL